MSTYVHVAVGRKKTKKTFAIAAVPQDRPSCTNVPPRDEVLKFLEVDLPHGRVIKYPKDTRDTQIMNESFGINGGLADIVDMVLEAATLSIISHSSGATTTTVKSTNGAGGST